MKKLLLTILSTFLLVGCGQNDISSLSISEESFSSITTSEEDTSSSSISETTSLSEEDTSSSSTFETTSLSEEDISSSSTFETTSLETYYASAIGTGMDLLNQLHKITETNFKTITYKGLWEAYKTTDVRTDGKVMDIYSNITNYTFGTDQAGSYKKEGDCYNREHTIPQSWWGKGTSNQGCDIFIVYPSDGYVNNIRGNLPYGEVGTTNYKSANNYCRRGTSALTGYSGIVFEIADEWKGDIARSCFYALTKWTSAPTWTSSEGSAIFSGSYNTNYGLTDYALNLYLKWHREDPVSEWEQQRNDRCEEVQGNRNPYIDNPSFVESIWGSL